MIRNQDSKTFRQYNGQKKKEKNTTIMKVLNSTIKQAMEILSLPAS
jgi:hypothetical protein